MTGYGGRSYRLLLSHSFSRDFGSAPTFVAAGLPSLNRISVGMPRTRVGVRRHRVVVDVHLGDRQLAGELGGESPPAPGRSSCTGRTTPPRNPPAPVRSAFSTSVSKLCVGDRLGIRAHCLGPFIRFTGKVGRRRDAVKRLAGACAGRMPSPAPRPAAWHHPRVPGPDQRAAHRPVREDAAQHRAIGGHLAQIQHRRVLRPRRRAAVGLEVGDQHLVRQHGQPVHQAAHHHIADHAGQRHLGPAAGAEQRRPDQGGPGSPAPRRQPPRHCPRPAHGPAGPASAVQPPRAAPAAARADVAAARAATARGGTGRCARRAPAAATPPPAPAPAPRPLAGSAPAAAGGPVRPAAATESNPARCRPRRAAAQAVRLAPAATGFPARRSAGWHGAALRPRCRTAPAPPPRAAKPRLTRWYQHVSGSERFVCQPHTSSRSSARVSAT